MKAVVMNGFGGPEVLEYQDAPDPSAKPGEVVVDIHAVSVNYTLDVVVRSGRYPRGTDLPHVLGCDGAGIVTEVGDGVTGLSVGDRVALHGPSACGQCEHCLAGSEGVCRLTRIMGVEFWGAYAERVAVPATIAFPVADSISFPDATVIMRHAPTARHMLDDKAELKPGESVLVMGAAGGLGMNIVQVAKMMGATVIAAAGSDERVATALSYGADHGINYRDKDLEKEVLALTGGQGVEVVAENIADPSLWDGAFNSLAQFGRMVTAGAHGGGVVPLNVGRLYTRRQRIIGTPGCNYADISWALDRAGKGEIKPAKIDRILPLRDAAEAHRLSEARAVLGKVVLDPKV